MTRLEEIKKLNAEEFALWLKNEYLYMNFNDGALETGAIIKRLETEVDSVFGF